MELKIHKILELSVKYANKIYCYGFEWLFDILKIEPLLKWIDYYDSPNTQFVFYVVH